MILYYFKEITSEQIFFETNVFILSKENYP